MNAWQGVVVALPTPFRADLSLDLDRLQEHVGWLAAAGCDAVSPCGPLGEYQNLSDAERADVVRATVEAAPAGCAVVAGAGGYGSRQATFWAAQAADAGARAVLAPPPHPYRASDAEVVAHYRAVAAVGLPVVVHNDPSTLVELPPDLLARIAETQGIAAVTTIGADLHRLRDLCPHLDLVAGADDMLLEAVVCGATGWLAALPNAFPRLGVDVYARCASRDVSAALPLYSDLHPLLRCSGSVQAVKFSMELAERYGGPSRPPRAALPAHDRAAVTAAVARALLHV
ncbi:dihydrodipicolinate synthase family protein [Virgisporangium aliadipatigenens]|uniref:Dihydrodipicolinate synthase family protein n=1 Tax=Virgisporangium aliadipatigenens TaxID=741659 RepID=A0A8J4DNU3_9ACTN|nr:dihydrodipicolinate synthase family protein [Virgisporangium aliadipatigenens]GIJ44171.1 dihydrodipicolinate synthase family protein [Virgisporangium aliadipatigenens]